MDWILSFIKVKREAKVNVSLTCSTILGKIIWKNNVHQSNPSVPYMDNVRQYSLIAFLATFRDKALVMFIGTWFYILTAVTEKLLSDTFLWEALSNTLRELGLSCLLLYVTIGGHFVQNHWKSEQNGQHFVQISNGFVWNGQNHCYRYFPKPNHCKSELQNIRHSKVCYSSPHCINLFWVRLPGLETTFFL